MMIKNKTMKTWLLSICLIAISFTNTSFAKTENKLKVKINLPHISAFQPIIEDIQQRFPKSSTDSLIVISASEQKLFLIENNQVTESHIISTATAGLGNNSGSNKTPLGIHRISEKIGTGAKLGTIFKARANTRRLAKILTEPNAKSKADNVTSRILWLSGMEKGINKGGKVDSHARYIYIHGTDEEGRLGQPASHGCIRMANTAVIDLFNKVSTGTIVSIIK